MSIPLTRASTGTVTRYRQFLGHRPRSASAVFSLTAPPPDGGSDLPGAAGAPGDPGSDAGSPPDGGRA